MKHVIRKRRRAVRKGYSKAAQKKTQKRIDSRF